MSRLDDELRIAFRRKEPSIDIAARVLERINEAPAPKKNWRQKIAAIFEPPKLRWVAAGVAASLLLAIGVAQYYRLKQTPVEENSSVAQNGSAPAASDPAASDTKTGEAAAAPDAVDKDEKARDAAPARRVINSRVINKSHLIARSASHRPRLAATPKEQPISAEAEAAKERVLFALQIVGSTLGDAQRVIQEDSQKSKPEPLHNR